MSKIGTKTIAVPPTVTIQVEDASISVKGKEGEMRIQIPSSLQVHFNEQILTVTRKNEKSPTKALHGLYRSLIYNAVVGVEVPWEKKLEVVGTGFQVKMQGEDLVFKVGFSHPVVFKKVPRVQFLVDGNTKVILKSVDKQLVGEVAHKIKMLKKPDAYKGKGIKYEGERLRIKPGKKAKTA